MENIFHLISFCSAELKGPEKVTNLTISMATMHVLLAVVSRTRKTLRVSTMHLLQIAHIPVVSSKKGAVLDTRKFHH
jgi:hypothetical protein